MKPLSEVDQAHLIDLQVIANPKGHLTVIEGAKQVPFDIARVYYISGVPAGQDRGGHAHRTIEQFIVAVAGSFDVVIDDGTTRRTFSLTRSSHGLYVPHLLWRELQRFSADAVCLVLASAHFDEGDYCRDYAEFQRARRR